MGDTGRCFGPGHGAEHLRPLQAALPLAVHRHHHDADHRDGDGRLRGARPRSAEERVRTAYAGEKACAGPVRRRPPDRACVQRDQRHLGAAGQQHPRGPAFVANGEKIPLKTRLKVRRDQVLGSPRAIDAIDSLFEASGGRALSTGPPTSSGRGATRTPAGCTRPTTPSARCRCTAPTSSATRSTPGCTDAPPRGAGERSGAADAPRWWPGSVQRQQLRLRAASLRRTVPHDPGRPAGLRSVREATRRGQLLPLRRRPRRQAARRARPRAASTCWATRWAAAPRCASP